MDKYLSCKDYREYKRDVLDPLKVDINNIGKMLNKSRKNVNGLFIEELPTVDDSYILPDDEEYQTFCDKVVLELDKEVRECELNKFRIDERRINFWDFSKKLIILRGENICKILKEILLRSSINYKRK